MNVNNESILVSLVLPENIEKNLQKFPVSLTSFFGRSPKLNSVVSDREIWLK